MFSYQYLNIPDGFWIDDKLVSYIFEKIGELIDIPQNGILNIAFLSDEEIQSLNNQYRWIDKTTDVLSFHYFEDFSDINPEDIAGEVILSESKIRSQAPEYGNTIEEEFYKLLIHSILHILWYDHEEDGDYAEMKVEEDKIIESIKNSFGVTIR